MMANFNIIIKHMIQKSLFTERQIEIITRKRDQLPPISRGAYYRQRAQTAQKTQAVLYSMVLLYALGAIPTKNAAAIAQIAEQMAVIFDSDIDESEAVGVLDVVEQAINRALDM